MIRSKNNNGFTLIEVLVAVAIMALLLTPLFVTQGTIFQSMSEVSVRMRRIFLGENFLEDARIEAQEKQKFTFDKKIDDPQTQLTYKAQLVDKNSQFKDMQDLVAERVTISWQEGKAKREDALISFIYKPEQQKVEKKAETKKDEKPSPKKL